MPDSKKLEEMLKELTETVQNSGQPIIQVKQQTEADKESVFVNVLVKVAIGLTVVGVGACIAILMGMSGDIKVMQNNQAQYKSEIKELQSKTSGPTFTTQDFERGIAPLWDIVKENRNTLNNRGGWMSDINLKVQALDSRSIDAQRNVSDVKEDMKELKNDISSMDGKLDSIFQLIQRKPNGQNK